MNNVFKNINFNISNIKNNIYEIIDNLKLTCDKELIREKNFFEDKILEYIFNSSIINFMKGNGKSYLDDKFFNDYELKIISKLIIFIANLKKLMNIY